MTRKSSSRGSSFKRKSPSAVPISVYRAAPFQGLEPRVMMAADLVFNEIMYQPSSHNVGDEWVELYNRGDAAQNLSGWKLAKGVDFTFGNTTLNPGQYLVVAANLAKFQAKYPGVNNVVGGWTGQLSNTQETLRIENAGGSAVDSVTYSDQGDWADRRRGALDNGHYGWDWVQPASGLGNTLELINPTLNNNYGQNWDTSTVLQGTPGAQNSIKSADIAPMIVDLKQSVIIPKSTDPVKITVKLIDELTTGLSAAVWWRLDNAGQNFAPLAMVDNGTNGDALANDGIWTATIPAQADKKIVEFYVKATDAGNKSRTWPAPTDTSGTQGANALYQVDDTPYVGTEPLYRLIFTEVERAELAQIGQFQTASNARMNGTFVQNDARGPEIHYQIGVRNRGHGSRNGPPNNYHVDFASDDLWHGRKAVNFNVRLRQSQVLGAAIWHLSNIAASSDTVPVQLQVNAGTPANSSGFVLIEQTDSNYAANHYADDPNGNYYSTDRDASPGAILDYRGTNANSYRQNYFKDTNADVDDYSDIFHLTDVLNNTPTNQLYAAAQQVLDLDQWIKYIALDNLMENTETEFGSGFGDDYGLYRGAIDTRFKLAMHDQDSIMGTESSDFSRSLFAFLGVTGVQKLFALPEVLQKFYQAHLDLMAQFYNPTVMNPLIDNVLNGVASPSQIASFKAYVVNRSANVLSQIPQTFSVASSLPITGGYPQTGSTTASLTGKANAARTLSVFVNGLPATYDAKAGTWTISNVPLQPGVNRLTVQAFDGVNGTGNVVDSGFIDVQRTAATPPATTVPGGTLPAGVTTWSPANGPYTVTGDIVVNAGSTLTILPGTTVYFQQGTGVTFNGGRLLAEGTAFNQIRFTRVPGTTAVWDGLQFTGSNLDNRITYATLEYAGTTDEGTLGVTDSRVTVDHAYFANTDRRRIKFSNASLVVRDSVFTDVFAAATSPTTNNLSEQVFGSGILAGGQMLFERNTFGTTKGHNDVMDMTGGARPGAVFVIRDNVFNGGGDDALNLNGDALVEGNTFKNFNRDAFNADAGNPSVLSAGGGRAYTVVRNTVVNSAFVVEVKQGSFVTFVNNTVVGGAAQPTFSFNAPDFPGAPGAGALIDGNVFKGRPTLLGAIPGGATVTATRNVVASTAGLGAGNTTEDPRFVNEALGNYALRPGSPAKGTGPNGLDMGALVPRWVLITGEPGGTVGKSSATLTVGGPGIVSYMYRVNGGAWSAETPVGTPINLSGLTPGAYTVQVIGRNDAGELQDVAAPTSSRTWTVNTAAPSVRVNEVLAVNNAYLSNGGAFPDLIELFNTGDATVDLSGLSISDDPTSPLKYVFAAGTTIAPGQYLVLYADSKVVAGQVHTGFSLKGDGEGVYLFDKPAAGGALIDGVTFGNQIDNLSIGRLANGTWALNQPTFGAANVAQRTGDASTVKINEWNTQGIDPFATDFIELYNPDALPIALGGYALTDHPASLPAQSLIPALSFMPANSNGAGGYLTFVADGDAAAGGLHANFSLSGEQGMIGLFDPNKVKIDEILYLSQRLGQTQGRSPDGGTTQAFFIQPSPGVSNPGAITSSVPLRITELNFNPPQGTGANSSDYEFIELQNTGASPINLNGVKLNGVVTFTFGNVSLAAGQYIVLVGNAAAFAERYGTGINVGGTFVGALDNNGGQIRLTDAANATILDFGYSDAWQPTADGGGDSIVFVTPASTPAANWGVATNWRASRATLGTPGLNEDAALTAGPGSTPAVVINEVVANTAGNAADWVELRNTTGAAVDVSGWYVSDDAAHLLKFRLPAGTVVPANGYLVLNQAGANGFGGSFSLAGGGGSFYLSSAAVAGALTGYRQGVDFGAGDAGASQGRTTLSTGAVDFVALATPTPGAANAAPQVGPIVISEIMYRPSGSADEYVELYNRSSRTVDLSGWKFTNGIELTFPAGTSLAPGAYLLIVAGDAATFRSANGLPASVAVIGNFAGALDNAGDTVELSRPGVAEAGAPAGTTPMVVDDRVMYGTGSPWPGSANGTGASLERRGPALYGNDPANWQADVLGSGAGGSRGTGGALAAPTVVGSVEFVEGRSVSFSFAKDVSGNVHAADLTLVNVTTGQTITGLLFNYDPSTRTATWTMPSGQLLPDGDYTATLSAAAIRDASGTRALDGNGDGVAGDDYSVALFKFGGDTTRDRTIDFNDLIKIAQNYNTVGGMSWATGDFTQDGTTDFNDLIKLAQNYNTTFPSPGAPAPAPVAALSFDGAWAAAVAAAAAPVSPTPTPGAGTTPAPAPTPVPTRPVVTKPIVAKPVATKPPPAAPVAKPVKVAPKPVAKAPLAAKPAAAVVATKTTAKPVATTIKPVAKTPTPTPRSLTSPPVAPASPFGTTRIHGSKQDAPVW